MARKELLYGLWQFFMILALAHADFIETSLDNCVNFDLALVEKYTSSLNTTENLSIFTLNSEGENQENLRSFGTLKSDWTRLNLLHDSLPEDTELKTKFKFIIRLLLIAHEQATKSLRLSGSDDFRDNLVRKTTEFFSIDEHDESERGIGKSTPIGEFTKFPNSNASGQNRKMRILPDNFTSGDLSNETNVSSASMPENLGNSSYSLIENEKNAEIIGNTNESSNSYEEEKNTVTPFPNIAKDSTIFQTSNSSTLIINDSPFNQTDFVTESGETLSSEETTIFIAATISDEEIFANSKRENITSVPFELTTTGSSILLPNSAENKISSSDQESQEIFGIPSKNFTLGTMSILEEKEKTEEDEEEKEEEEKEEEEKEGLEEKDEKQGVEEDIVEELPTFTESPEVGNISDNVSTKNQLLNSTPSEDALMSMKMADESTLWAPSLTTMSPVENVTVPQFFEPSRDEKVSSIIPSKETAILKKIENTSGTRFSIPIEYSSAEKLTNILKAENQSSTTTPSNENLFSRKHEIENNSSATKITYNSETQRRFSTTTSSEDILLSKNYENDKTSPTLFSTLEETLSSARISTLAEYSSSTQSAIVDKSLSAGEFTTIKNQSQSPIMNSSREMLSSDEHIENTSQTQYLTPEEYSSVSEMIIASTTQNELPTPGEDTLMSRKQKIENTLQTQFSTLEEYSSTPLIPSKQEIENTSSTLFSTPEEHSSASKLTTASRKQNETLTTSSEVSLILKNEEIDKTSWTLFSTTEEYSSAMTISNYPSIDDQSLIMTPSENLTVSTKQEIENTEFPMLVDNKRTSIKEEESSSNKTPPQSPLNVNDSSDRLDSQIHAATISEHVNLTENPSITINSIGSTTVIATTVNENDEIKTTSYDERGEIFRNEESSTEKSNIFSTISAVLKTSKKVIDEKESQEEKTKQDLVGKDHTTASQLAEETTTRHPFKVSTKSIITIANETAEVLIDWQHTETTETSMKKSEKENLRTDNYQNVTGSEMKQVDGVSAIAKPSQAPSSLNSLWRNSNSNLVKNPLHHNAPINNHIFHNYKHGTDDSWSEKKNPESSRIVLYESGVGAPHQGVWRPQLDRQLPPGNNIWRYPTFANNLAPNGYRGPSTSMKINFSSPTQAMNKLKLSIYTPNNVLRSRKRGSANADIAKQFRWFYRQGQSDDQIKSRKNDNDDTKIKIRCKITQRH